MESDPEKPEQKCHEKPLDGHHCTDRMETADIKKQIESFTLPSVPTWPACEGHHGHAITFES